MLDTVDVLKIFFAGAAIIIGLKISLFSIQNYLLRGGQQALFSGRNLTEVIIDLSEMKPKSTGMYLRQYLMVTFTDNSQVRILSGLSKDTDIPMLMAVTGISEDDCKLGIQQQKLEMHQFMKGFELHALTELKFTASDGSVFNAEVVGKHQTGFLLELPDECSPAELREVSFCFSVPVDIEVHYRYRN